MDEEHPYSDDRAMKEVDAMARDVPERLSRELAFSLAAYALVGSGVYLQSMQKPWPALWLQTLGLLTIVCAVLGPRMIPRTLPMAPRQLAALLVAGLAAAMLATPPGVYTLIKTMAVYGQYLALAAAMACLASAIVVFPRLFGRATSLVLIGLILSLGIWTLRNAPSPFIDLFTHHQISCRAILEGTNPYAIRFPDIYGAGSPFTNSKMIQDGFTTHGFAYPPTMLYVALPAYAIVGDYRFAYLGCIAAAAAIFAMSRLGWNGLLAAVLLLMAPRLLHILESGWTESPIFAALAAFVFLAHRGSIWSALPLAILLSSKQYFVGCAPLFLLMLPRPYRWSTSLRYLGLAAGTAAVIHVPWLAASPSAYLNSLVEAHVGTPFRPDSISWMSALARDRVEPWSYTLGPVASFIVAVVFLWRAPRNAFGFCLGMAASLSAFALLTRGFINYHFMVLIFIVGAIAASKSRDAEGRAEATPNAV